MFAVVALCSRRSLKHFSSVPAVTSTSPGAAAFVDSIAVVAVTALAVPTYQQYKYRIAVMLLFLIWARFGSQKGHELDFWGNK